MAKLAIGRKTCQCTGCGDYFTTVAAFDMHRVFDNPEMPDWRTRHCMSEAEMLAVGMSRNDRGYWMTGTQSCGSEWYKRGEPAARETGVTNRPDRARSTSLS